MPTSSRISGPTSVELGQTGTGRISVICWNATGPTTLSYGIGYKAPGVGSGKSSWHGFKNYTKSVPCDQSFEFTFEATQELLNKQKAGNALFVYSCDAMADRPIAGVGKGRYSYFAITQPGSAPVSGRSYVATSISKRGSGDDLIVKLYADKYKDGRIDRAAQKYGGAKAGPDGKVFRKYFAGFWSYVRFMRVSLYNKLAQDEKDWLIAKGVAVVPANWTPAEGVPRPKYQLAGEFTEVPRSVSISPVPGWGVKLGNATLPVTFDLQGRSCTDIFGGNVTPPNIAGLIPVMFTVNGVTIATLTPASQVTIDLAQLFSLWATTLTMDANAITLTAQTATTTIEGVTVPGISVTKTIPVTDETEPAPSPAPSPAPEESKGDRRNPKTCWDGSQVMTEVFRDNVWVPSGEECPPQLPERNIRMAVINIAYEGQAVDIVVQAFCGAAASQGEPATLKIDGAEPQTKTTSAGEVRFRWTAKGVGMRKITVDIPVNPNCAVSGHASKTITVSAYVGEILEQIKKEKLAYEEELETLKKLKKAEKAKLIRHSGPGTVKIPASLAGMIVEVGGVPTTVPEDGITVKVPSGESIVTIIEEGVRTDVPVILLPGEAILLPTLPGGL